MKSLIRLCCVVLIAFSAGRVTAAEPIGVLATFSILGDLVSQIGGERVDVEVLVGPDKEAHGFQPRASDARKLGEVRLVVANGLGFDTWIERLIKSAGYKGMLLIASKDAKLIGGDGKNEQVDPHAWQDVANAEIYVRNIAEALAQVDPAGAPFYRANARHFITELRSLDQEIRSQLSAIPAAQRKVVTGHDAFAYFARAYDVQFIAPVGISNDAAPSARRIAALIKQIRSEQISAVFLESLSDARQIERIQKESGARIGGRLYADALSRDDGPAPTYLDMMRHNLRTLLEGLKGGA